MPNPQPRLYEQTLMGTNGQSCPFQLVEVKGGVFQMGSEDEDAYDWEKPVHPVKVSDFWIGEYVVTQALWKAVMGEEHAPFYFQGDQRPAERVSWETINEQFLPRLNEMTGENYRLPTEAEWEYAARGGINHSRYKYAGSNRLKEVGWYIENSHRETKPVGLKKPNALGLYDMSGNVYEWCADWYEGSSYYQKCKDEGTVENPTGPAQGRYRVMRGGYWDFFPWSCRVSFRGFDPQFDSGDVGFRLVVSVLQSAG
ncbi:formylglycine-generating enzyme family protein [Haliscomenobacter hydrossis]|uniref:Sulphatase-modifying factor protein n=1 Tax=Haliscomenobacter hydrossis (strain ATCC 27775 / DSM 1100 / LMG 10767 / O) TaxID=760192 RepID=F4KTY7_HALH1|nr:formylglycine-generating enzyme family protein [Haliscomenobacter hydrossis]AEE49123.1 Sulphatase-modifying factor protein [Haliscomenobacter hydrossis DSM 1100]